MAELVGFAQLVAGLDEVVAVIIGGGAGLDEVIGRDGGSGGGAECLRVSLGLGLGLV